MKDVVKDLIAGTIGGAGGIVVGHPIDTVKVRLQVDRSYGGVMDCVTRTLRMEGATSFYKGVVAPVLGAAPINAVVFVTYGGVIRLATEHHHRKNSTGLGNSETEPQIPLLYHTLAGCCAGAAQTVFGCPNELVKIKCQMHRQGEIGSLEMGKLLTRQCGFRGLFQGTALTFWRDMPAFGIYFTTYEIARDFLHGSQGLSDMWAVFFAGGIAGASSFFFTHPVDVVKSLRQEQHGPSTPFEQTRIRNLTRALYKEGGAAAFARGLWPSVFRAFPVSAVTFLIYDTLLDLLPLMDRDIPPPRRLADDLNYLL